MVVRSDQYQHGRSRERSPLRPHHSSTSYGGCSPGARPPGLDPQYKPDLPPTVVTTRRLGILLVFLVILAPIVVLVFFYDMPTKLDNYSRATARMREQRDGMRREARHLESERIALQGESDRLEEQWLALESATLEMEGEKDALESAIRRSEQERSRLEQERSRLKQERSGFEQERSRLEQERSGLEQERLGFEREKLLWEDERHLLEREKEELKEERERWEKAREDRIPQGAFWGTEPLPAWDCRAYGKREYWAELQNIPEDWTDMDACTNMPTTIKGVFLRRPDRCGYVGGSPHIHAYWMVDWDQPGCKPWHTDITDKVSSEQPIWLHLHTRLGSRTPISRVALTRDLAPVVSKPGSWTSTTGQNKTGACCARAHRSHGITSRIAVLRIARHA